MKTYLQKGSNSLLIINQKTSKKVLVSDVILLEGHINYTTFHLQNGSKKVVAHSIKFFEPYLQTQGFLRTHRSFMINPTHVKTYNKLEEILTMSNGRKAFISRRKKRSVENHLNFSNN